MVLRQIISIVWYIVYCIKLNRPPIKLYFLINRIEPSFFESIISNVLRLYVYEHIAHFVVKRLTFHSFLVARKMRRSPSRTKN